MNERIPITSGEIIFGKDFLNYQDVLDDFKRAKCIRVMTYNISKDDERNEVINALKNVSEDVDIKIITNIPSRMDKYYNSSGGDRMRENCKENLDAYLKRLNPKNFSSNTEVRFNFSNHAKIIGTENILYVGSANYSDESKNNFEIGTIITNTETIQEVYEKIFRAAIKESIPYFEDDFNKLRLFVSRMEKEFKCWLDKYDSNFNDLRLFVSRILCVSRMEIKFKCWLDKYDNNLHSENEFTILLETLKELLEISKELHNNIGSLLKNTYTELDDDYNTLIDKIQTELSSINIEWMLVFTSMCSEECNWIIDKEQIIDINKKWIIYEQESDLFYAGVYRDEINLCDKIKTIIKFLENIHEGILEYSYKWINKKINNTGLELKKI